MAYHSFASRWEKRHRLINADMKILAMYVSVSVQFRSFCFGARGPVVRALDQRVRGLGFDSPTGHE
jgi:hypothetical protein